MSEFKRPPGVREDPEFCYRGGYQHCNYHCQESEAAHAQSFPPGASLLASTAESPCIHTNRHSGARSVAPGGDGDIIAQELAHEYAQRAARCSQNEEPRALFASPLCLLRRSADRPRSRHTTASGTPTQGQVLVHENPGNRDGPGAPGFSRSVHE